MQFQILRTPGVPKELFSEVGTIFEKYPDFIFENQPVTIEDEPIRTIDEQQFYSWESLFQAGQANNHNPEHKVILLTEHYNQPNWFAAADAHLNYSFIQTSGWDSLLGPSINATYPIAYHIAFLALTAHMFDDFTAMKNRVHYDAPRGCVLDFCQNKEEVKLKMRTGDLCNDCLTILAERQINIPTLIQLFEIFDHVRQYTTFINRFAYLNTPSYLELRNTQFFLPYILGNQPLGLSPVQKTILTLYLNHPEGIPLTHWHDHREEIQTIYGLFSNRDDVDEQHTIVQNILNNDNKNEYLSRIRREFRSKLGDNLASFYTIERVNNNGNFTIALDRDLFINQYQNRFIQFQ